jgi:hypothetical protein
MEHEHGAFKGKFPIDAGAVKKAARISRLGRQIAAL